MVGTESEQNGVIKHGSKMIQAVANTRVPKLSIVIGGSYGAGNYAMCGRGLDPHFIFAWPNSNTAVMGGAQAGKVLRIVTEAKQQKMGITPDENVLNFLEMSTAAKLESQSTALFNTAKLFDDGVIDPAAEASKGLFRVKTFVEKPKPEDAPSDLAIIGRYLLTPEIFEELENTAPGKGGEIQLTDAIAKLQTTDVVEAYRMKGQTFDCGSKLGYLKAVLHYGVDHPKLGEDFKALIQKLAL